MNCLCLTLKLSCVAYGLLWAMGLFSISQLLVAILGTCMGTGFVIFIAERIYK